MCMEPKDLDPEAQVRMDIEIAIFGEELDQVLKTLSRVAQDRRVVERSSSMLPYFTVKLLTAPGQSFRLRFTVICGSPSEPVTRGVTGNAQEQTGPHGSARQEEMAPLPRRFTMHWLQPPSRITNELERASWVPTPSGWPHTSPADSTKIAIAMLMLRQEGIPRSYETEPSAFLTEVLDKVAPSLDLRRPDIIMGGIRRPPTPPPTSRLQKFGCGGKRCVIQ